MQQIISQCRCCGSEEIELIHDFGAIPIADQLTEKKEALDIFPISVGFCTNCFHLQVRENIDPKILFQNNYPYYSSLIPEVVQHFKSTYKSINNKLSIGNEDIVLEIASNDGVLIQQFSANTKKLYGVEPSRDHAVITCENGIKTYNQFFNATLAESIAQDLSKSPQLILACNVLAHVPNPDDFVKGLTILADENTTIVIEVPHSLPMMQKGTFDVIFHQHFSFFNISTLQKMFLKHGLVINDVEEIATQGGGMRLFISKSNKINDSVKFVQLKEKSNDLYNVETYHLFSEKIKRLKIDTLELLNNIKKDKKSIIGYGAPGKAATFLNYIGIDDTYFDCLIDISPSKQYKFFPNTGLQIFPLDYLKENHVDYVFILTWNYSESILKNLNYLRENGTKFILSYPEIDIV